MPDTIALDRDALYYPYIHIRDVNWLKSTLLCFPSVRRIVPKRFNLHDSDEIQEFCQTDGPRGALLSSADLDSPALHQAQHTLLRKMELHEHTLTRLYGRETTLRS